MTPLSVELRDLPPIPLAVLRRTVSAAELSRVIPDCCGTAWKILRAQGAKPGRGVALYWDGAIRLEAGVEMSEEFTEQDGLVRSATPGGRVAVVTHLGPYQRLCDAHSAVVAWAQANGHQLAGPNWELYGHWEESWNADPSRIRTEVCYQVV